MFGCQLGRDDVPDLVLLGCVVNIGYGAACLVGGAGVGDCGPPRPVGKVAETRVVGRKMQILRTGWARWPSPIPALR